MPASPEVECSPLQPVVCAFRTEGFRRKLPLERDPRDSREEKERDLGSGGCLCVPRVPDSNVVIVKELEVGQQKNSEDET